MRLMKRFLDVKFRNKLLISYILLALIPLIFFSVVSGIIFIGQARQSAFDHTSQMMLQVCNAIDVYISTIEKTGNYVALNLTYTGFFETDGKASAGAGSNGAIENQLRRIAESHPEIAGIMVVSEDDVYASTGMSRISRDPFAYESWYRLAAQSPDEIILNSNVTGRNIVTNLAYSTDDVFSMSKAIRDPKSGKVRGVILFDVRHDIIKDSINSATIGQKGFVFVTDAKNNIVYTQVNDIVYRVNPRWFDRPDRAAVTAGINGEKYQICYKQSEYTGWKTVGVFSLDEVMGGVNAIIIFLIICIFSALVLILLASFYVSASVTTPILKLKKLMKKAEDGDLSVHFNSRYKDEIGELGTSFNRMIDQIDHLIHIVYVEQQNKRIAELKSLQEQIKPHFLYNTLDTISWMAREYDAKDIVQLVDALTSMFRIGLSRGKDIITVQEEITHVSNYLYIQKIRYRDKLEYSVDVDQPLYRYKVPKLILQPLVENAIYHGLKQKRAAGMIVISARITGEQLVFTVRDGGTGIPAQKLAELNEQLGRRLELNEEHSFGLFYIKERIYLCYGEGYGISLDSREGEGTTVTVTLPLND